MSVEHSEPRVPGFRDYAWNDEVEEPPKLGVPGFRDYARNDKVEDPTLCGECRRPNAALANEATLWRVQRS